MYQNSRFDFQNQNMEHDKNRQIAYNRVGVGCTSLLTVPPARSPELYGVAEAGAGTVAGVGGWKQPSLCPDPSRQGPLKLWPSSPLTSPMALFPECLLFYFNNDLLLPSLLFSTLPCFFFLFFVAKEIKRVFLV